MPAKPFTGVTDSNGTVPGLPNLKALCTYTATFSKARWVTRAVTFTKQCNPETVGAVTTAAPGFQCTCSCNDPLSDPWYISDAAGLHPITNNGSLCLQSNPVPVACYDPLNGCAGGGGNASVGYFYQVFCDGPTGARLVRTMTACIGPGGAQQPIAGRCTSSGSPGIDNPVPAINPNCAFIPPTGQPLFNSESQPITVSPTCGTFIQSVNFTFGFPDTAVMSDGGDERMTPTDPPAPGFEYLWQMLDHGTEDEQRHARLMIANVVLPDAKGGNALVVDTRPAPVDSGPHQSVYVAGTIPLEVSLDLNRRMKACPHRVKATDCGCGGMSRCTFPYRRRIVNDWDCFTCLGASIAQ